MASRTSQRRTVTLDVWTGLSKPRPTEKSVSDTYADDQYGQDRLKSLFDSQFDVFRAKMKVLAKWLASSASPRIVEVVSFVGGFLAAGKEKGWSMLGVDPWTRGVGLLRHAWVTGDRGTLDDTPGGQTDPPSWRVTGRARP